MAHGQMITLPERYARDDEINSNMYGLQIFQLRVGYRPITREKIHVIELDYPLDHHAQTLLRIGPNFVELVDDNIPTYEELEMRDSYIESTKENSVDPNFIEEA